MSNDNNPTTVFNRNLTCIVCPMGCKLNISKDEQGKLTVTGNSCIRGEKYGIEEITDPRRTVTATCPIRDSSSRCPVKTERPVPKLLIDEILNEIYRTEVELPVPIGKTIIENCMGTGIKVIATSSINSIN